MKETAVGERDQEFGPHLPACTVFLDFEASSLNKHGYPIEVAWVFENGAEESHLIKPHESWTDWSDEAEAIHKIPRDRLMTQGAPVEDVAQRMVAVLTGHSLYATAPSWDGQWLSKLLRAAGLPRHSLRLQDTDEAHRRAVIGILEISGVPEEQHEDIVQDLLAKAEVRDDELGPPEHRALADARRELRLWREMRRCAEDIAKRLGKAR